jgi:predicted acyltransferase
MGIHKDIASPTWILYSLAIACIAYALLYWLVDVKKFMRWTALVRPAGSNALLLYLSPHILYAAMAVAGITYLHTHFTYGWPGVARSAVIAVGLVAVTDLLTRCRIRMQM